MTSSIGRLLGGILLVGALASTAVATTPESGTISKAAPKVQWTGETSGGYLTRMPTAVSGSTDTPCESPSCETFALKVADSADLTVGISLDSTSETGAVTVRITKPDGEIMQADSDPGAAASGKYFKMSIKAAPVGDYTINVFDNATAMGHKGYAELAVEAAPPSGTNPEPGGTPVPAAQPAPAGQTSQPAEVGVTVGKLSAKKLAKSRKFTAKVKLSRPVDSLQASFQRGKTVVAKGARGASSGTVSLTLALTKAQAKKLKAGAHTLTVVAADKQSKTVKTVKVKVAK